MVVIMPFAQPVVHELTREEALVQHARVQAAILSTCNERQERHARQMAMVTAGYSR